MRFSHPLLGKNLVSLELQISANQRLEQIIPLGTRLLTESYIYDLHVLYLLFSTHYHLILFLKFGIKLTVSSCLGTYSKYELNFL